MPPRFGATKFRNAVPAFPGKEDWYRSSLPGLNDAPQNTSSYSSVIKTSREWIVTLTPAGDCSVRGYKADGAEPTLWSGKLGGVVDWDISGLEDGGMVIAHADGTVSRLQMWADGRRCITSLMGQASQLLRTL